MSNLSLHIRVPELDEDEFFSTSFLFHLAKNNVRILWNVVHFYFQDSTKSSEQVQDVIRITDLLENFYSEFFYYEMEVRFIDEPLEIESLIRGHLKEVVMINDCFNDFLGNGKPNNEVKTALLGLQAVLDMVVKSYSVYVPELFVMQYKHEKTPFTDPKSHELFNYIVDNWNYQYGQKWADIWNEIDSLDGFKVPYKNEYQNYIIQRFGYTGKFQYDKAKRPNNRDRQRLIELIENFIKK